MQLIDRIVPSSIEEEYSFVSTTTSQRKNRPMRTIRTHSKNILGIGIAYALAIAVWLPNTTHAGDQVKGAQKLSELNKVSNVGDLEALKVGDTLAMACAKCQTIIVKEVVSTAKGAQVLAADGKPTMLVGKHLCKGCGSTIEIVGHGKAKESKITHTCGSCGDTSAFCCATKPLSGATKGMEKK
jgi:hypothetical protein